LRDRCMILMCFYHGLRISELLGLTVRDIDLAGGTIFIRRLKNGFSTVHPLQPDERQLLGEWMSRRPLSNEGWLFPNAKGNHLTRQYMYKQLRHYGLLAGLAVRVHPHMLRHACGYELAEQGMDTRLIQDYLGHRNIRHTVHYTAGNAARFAQTWKKQRLAVVSEENEQYWTLIFRVMRTIIDQGWFALNLLSHNLRRMLQFKAMTRKNRLWYNTGLLSEIY
uniref:tyrosine-type recombinase/integrase n=1 Tax=Enterobacter ludwigii TaxID=299767 RepID=UPI003F706D96